VLVRPNDLTHFVIGGAIAVHRQLGPGLLESAYAACLAYELTTRGIAFRQQVPVPVKYGGNLVDCAYRADVVVENELLLELKSVDQLAPVHRAQVLTYLKLLDLHQPLIINFNVRRLIDGVQRVLR
jgi:GxxExxY protein